MFECIFQNQLLLYLSIRLRNTRRIVLKIRYVLCPYLFFSYVLKAENQVCQK